MLQTISWARFGAVLSVGLVIYYGYVLVRFYRRGLVSFVMGKGSGGNEVEEGREATAKVAREGSAGSGMAVTNLGVADKLLRAADGPKTPARTEGGQAALFPGDREGETPELFKVMEKVILLLRQMFGEAAATGVRRDELEDRIQSVLSGYRQLVKTPYQISINNFIQRSCTTSFSLLLSDKEIAGLWDE